MSKYFQWLTASFQALSIFLSLIPCTRHRNSIIFEILSTHFPSNLVFLNNFQTSSSTLYTLLMTYVNSVVLSNYCPTYFFVMNFFRYFLKLAYAFSSFLVQRILFALSLSTSTLLNFHMNWIAFAAKSFKSSQ